MAEKVRMYSFKPFGPFELPIEEDAVIAREQLKEFWALVDESCHGLSEALGCYVFAIRSEGTTLPWYVGKTEMRSFRFEAVQSHKLLHYESALRLRRRGTPLLYLLSRMTDGGKFRKVWKDGSSSVGRLEGLIIATALTRNPELLNKRMMKHLTQTQVPGYMNEPPGPRSSEAKALGALLGT